MGWADVAFLAIIAFLIVAIWMFISQKSENNKLSERIGELISSKDKLDKQLADTKNVLDEKLILIQDINLDRQTDANDRKHFEDILEDIAPGIVFRAKVIQFADDNDEDVDDLLTPFQLTQSEVEVGNLAQVLESKPQQLRPDEV